MAGKSNLEEGISSKRMEDQIRGLLDGINNPEVKEQVAHFFLKDVLDYINEMAMLLPLNHEETGYRQELETKLDRMNTQILLKGYCLEELLSDEETAQKAKDNFRRFVGAWIYKSAIVKWAFEKPKEYPEDYRILEIIYDNKPVSKGAGAYFDNNFLKAPFSVALRLRKDYFKDLLLDFINQSNSSRMNILNIGCGSCREIRELIPQLKTRCQVAFTCLDADEEALGFAQDALSGQAVKNLEFKFTKTDFRNIIKAELLLELYGRQDLVYSIGLIDYLADIDLKKLIRALYRFVKKGGKLIFAHKNRDKTFPPIYPDWFCDWKSYARNKDEVMRLLYACGISGFSITSACDAFGYEYYFTLTKLA